ncbi:hypothetical protein BDF22DRAFT_662519 [Syncephalis plumigaleata]|nr:hypothetical protein BDF22DRAFT_662519 [Syncephalis plumigaleata]
MMALGLVVGSLNIWMTIIGDITNTKNQVYGFRQSMAFSFGSIIGGYLLDDPQEQAISTNMPFISTTPYLLPLLVCAVLFAIGFTLTLLLLEETSSKYIYETKQSFLSDSAENVVIADAVDNIVISTRVSLRHIFSYEMLRKCVLPIVMMTAVYCNHSAIMALITLLLPAPVVNGGFAMSPKLMGTIIALSSIVNLLVSLVLYPPMKLHYGLLKLFRIGLGAELITILSNMIGNGVVFAFICFGVLVSLCAHLFAFSFTSTSAQILINNAAQSTGILGTVNGLSWCLSALSFTISPRVWVWSEQVSSIFPSSKIIVWMILLCICIASYFISHQVVQIPH